MEYSGKVAVVTGAGSGIGRGLAGKAGQSGMKVVICDVDTKGLKVTEEGLAKSGAEVLAMEVDVTDYNAVAKLADTSGASICCSTMPACWLTEFPGNGAWRTGAGILTSTSWASSTASRRSCRA
jgi:NAD(P)-dependent dehydrogenase (short-subunit alcohol dehydrogenase family)